jgi:hypothetical protein
LSGARQQAQALAGSGDLGGARVVLEQAISLGRARAGKDDPDVLATSLHLGQLLLAADDPAGARRVLEVAYSDGLWRLGDADPVMILLSYDLGIAAEELGNRHEARKAYGRVVEFGTGVLGRDHSAVARAHEYLGEPPEPGTVRIELPPPPTFAEPARQWTPPPVEPGRSAAPGQELAFQPARPSTPFDPAWEVGRGALTEPVGQGQELQHRFSAPPAAVVRHEPERSSYARKAPALFAVIAAILAAVIAVVALIVVLAQRGDPPVHSDTPVLHGAAPTDVVVARSGTTIRLTWTDPAHGTTTFIVAGGHPGEVLKPMGQVSLGVTVLTFNGLNPDLGYCFTVVAVYSTTDFASSVQACTSPVSGTPRPSTS